MVQLKNGDGINIEIWIFVTVNVKKQTSTLLFVRHGQLTLKDKSLQIIFVKLFSTIIWKAADYFVIIITA